MYRERVGEDVGRRGVRREMKGRGGKGKQEGRERGVQIQSLSLFLLAPRGLESSPLLLFLRLHILPSH